MQRILDYLVVVAAATTLIFSTACDDTAATNDPGTGGTAAGGAPGMGGAMGAGGQTGMGGAGTGGASMGGTPGMGGAPAGGEPGAGGTPACEPTAPLADTAAGDLAPATRFNSLEIPTSPDRSAELGCNIVDGGNEGTGLSGLLRLLMLDIADLVRPDEEDGSIQVILLGHLDGWEAGQTGDEATDTRLILYNGKEDGDTFLVARESFEGDDPANAPKIEFGADLTCGRIATASGTFEFGVPVLDTGLTLGLTLSATTVLGNLRAEATGFSVQKGSINGYLTFESIVALLTGVKAACESADPPSFCDQAGMFLGGDPEPTARTLVLPILRGLDSKVGENGTVTGDCITDGDCNAVSVCLAFESAGVSLSGYEE
jgi:hypothetical protein